MSWLLHILIATTTSAHGKTVHKGMRCWVGKTASPAYLCKCV